MPPLPLGSAERRFRLFLQSRGLRVTPERLQILRFVLETPGHLPAEEISFKIRNAGLTASRATVYRTLNHLVEAGLARKIDFGEGHAHFENAEKGEHHDHMVCTRCGKVIEFYNESVESLQLQIASDYGFQLHSHEFKLYGICLDCRNAAIA